MASRPPPPWAILTNHLRNDDSAWEIVTWWSVTGAFPSNYNVDGDANDCLTTFDGAIMPALGEKVVSDGCGLTINVAGVVYSGTAYGFTAGAINGDDLPSEEAGIVRVTSTHGARTGRGRHFIHGIPESATSESRLIGIGVGVFDAALDFFRQPIPVSSGMTLQPRVFSRKDAVMYPVANAAWASVIGHRRKQRPKF